ncbi:hypothetical protein FOVSG1_013385 [Fusarium oxysporum f. sp. vasinfectum]
MASKFERFNQTDLVFKTIGNTPLIASVLVPKTVQSGKRPLLVHFHGGGLIVGDRMYETWFALWMLQYAESEGAIIVSPDYRLIPEATGTDVLTDVEDFWDWVRDSFPAKVSGISSGLSLDLSRLAVTGESAGGFLSLQSAFLFPELDIKLVMVQYGTLDLEHHLYNSPPAVPPAADNELVEQFLKRIQPGDIRLSSPPPKNWDFCLAVLSTGRHRELMGSDERMLLARNLKAAKKLPAVWFCQGEEDEIMPLQVAKDVVGMVRKHHPTVPVHFSIQPGPHGFDLLFGTEEPWVKEGLAFTKQYW